ncbi:hypothetical protein [Maritalea myrionectae]|uniref:hypothetical protein n=1 Tax=Maritalea myrionectae TaxID=454601 RepID=UPI0012EC7CEF|nr:hypothetical protein [Maritalea myrionectae]
MAEKAAAPCHWRIGRIWADKAQRGTDLAFSEKPHSFAARVLAIVALAHGLFAIFYHFGATRDVNVPVDALGNIAFAIIILCALLRLLAAVGLWSLTAWGGVLLIVANVTELGAAFWSPKILDFSLLEIALRVLVLLAVAALLIWSNWSHKKRSYYL